MTIVRSVRRASWLCTGSCMKTNRKKQLGVIVGGFRRVIVKCDSAGR